MISKVTNHISPNEQLIFERSQPGRAGFSLPPLDVDETPLDEIIPREFQRDDDLAGMPEVTEVDVIRHFTRISTWNYSIDLGMYPLGSCTMKYNSRLNEKVARIAGFANLHPLAAEAEAQGALEVIYELQQHLAEITGLPGHFVATGRRRARRDDRHHDHPRVYRRARRQGKVGATPHDADSRFRARNESRVSASVRFHC